MTTVISVENISKSYRLGQIGSGTFSNDLKLWWAKARGKPNPMLKIGETDHGNRDGEELMALRDVSFTVQQGEVLGIIGKNGAGKSTLLKILSRVTAPTSGKIKVKGRIASLLEVGTGFHPELTGRENIYLNGAILGMSRQEVARKFDEIVDFSGVEKFIDTPVKRYSSGMYVRLAFAVAAHLDPEILVVDEVLAVGDAEFQKKCLGKMGEVAQGGRTVLFVSHNMPAVLSLCISAILLEKGSLTYSGIAGDVVSRYLSKSTSPSQVALDERADRSGDGSVRLMALEIHGGRSGNLFYSSDCLHITISYRSKKALNKLIFLIGVYDEFQRPIYFLDSSVAGGLPETMPDSGVVSCVTGPFNVTAGLCYVNVAVLQDGQLADHVTESYVLNVDADNFYGTGKTIPRQRATGLISQIWKFERAM